MITQQELKTLLHYDEHTGIFTRKTKVKGGGEIGSEVGQALNSRGYKSFMHKGVSYQLHRLAWFYVNGVWPKENIDHINRVKTDNRICNLREASKLLNNLNTDVRRDNKSGFKGVCFEKRRGKYLAHIRLDGRLKHLGAFDSAEKASEAYQSALAKRMMEFS